MTPPIQLLYSGPGAPDLSTSAYGPFVVHEVASQNELLAALEQQQFDAIVLQLTGPNALQALMQWAGLARLITASAVVVVAPEPGAADAVRLLQLGVQDVLPRRDGDGVSLARATRLAVARQAIAAAARKAYATDLATGLPNHAQLMEHMTHLFALREREPAAMALLVLHLEGLDAIEQRLGQEAAHVLRRKVAVRLRAGLRASDVVASVGADTFVVLLAWVDAGADGDRVAQKLAQSLQRPFAITGQDVAVAVAVGVARYPEHGKDAAALLGRAMGQAVDARRVGRAGVGSLGGAMSGSVAANDE